MVMVICPLTLVLEYSSGPLIISVVKLFDTATLFDAFNVLAGAWNTLYNDCLELGEQEQLPIDHA